MNKNYQYYNRLLEMLDNLEPTDKHKRMICLLDHIKEYVIRFYGFIELPMIDYHLLIKGDVYRCLRVSRKVLRLEISNYKISPQYDQLLDLYKELDHRNFKNRETSLANKEVLLLKLDSVLNSIDFMARAQSINPQK